MCRTLEISALALCGEDLPQKLQEPAQNVQRQSCVDEDNGSLRRRAPVYLCHGKDLARRFCWLSHEIESHLKAQCSPCVPAAHNKDHENPGPLSTLCTRCPTQQKKCKEMRMPGKVIRLPPGHQGSLLHKTIGARALPYIHEFIQALALRSVELHLDCSKHAAWSPKPNC